MKLTWMGTASLVLESGDEKILFDPFVELRGGEVPVTPDDFLCYDTVFVTHCHFAHLSFVTEIMEEGDATIFCTRQCCETLARFEEDCSSVVEIVPGQHLEIGDIDITPIHSRHIEFQWKRIFDTMPPHRLIRYAGNLPFLIWGNRTFREMGEIVAYDVKAEGREVLILGSLALDPDETYPEGADVLVMPYQGNNDLPARAREVIGRLKPKTILLSHFDNAFPPMSRNVDLRPLKKLMRGEYPDIRVVKPAAFRPMEL